MNKTLKDKISGHIWNRIQWTSDPAISKEDYIQQVLGHVLTKDDGSRSDSYLMKCAQNYCDKMLTIKRSTLDFEGKSVKDLDDVLNLKQRRSLSSMDFAIDSEGKETHGSMRIASYGEYATAKGIYGSQNRITTAGYAYGDSVPSIDLHVSVPVAEEHKSIIDAVANLEPKQRELIEALYYDNRSMRSYADEIGVDHTTVSDWHGKVLDQLKGKIPHLKP